MKGISHMISILIIVVIALVVAFATTNFVIFSIKPGIESTTALYLYPDSFYNHTSGVLGLHVESYIKPFLSIYKIEIGSVDLGGLGSVCVVNVIRGRAYIANNKIVILPGTELWIKCTVETPYIGPYVTISMYTDAGHLLRYNVEVVA